ncbi:formimidoylglutamase [Pseudofulvibacter geojedonensis]|uniref:Formimidoylglutamase n=1 Tax=Pseudofulvibacter geojedonensis TaxID=1123758 RepID=A0ABW3HZ89_9FLAO
MTHLNIYTQEEVLQFVNTRNGEKKFGEKVLTISKSNNLDEELINSKAKYVLFGIQESIGVKANKGIQGTETAWKTCLNSLLNTQNNSYNKGKKILLLGYLDFSGFMHKAEKLDSNNQEDLKALYRLVDDIDTEVSNLVYKIVKAGKIPIIIGGGHNNAYGNIKGTSLALNKAINAINFDAHTDFRALEGRHSGNGFSYAFQEGFLNKYFVFGLHENYTSKKVFNEMNALHDHINFNTFEAIAIRKENSFNAEIEYAHSFVKSDKYGVEIDLDAIQGVASSAMTPSGFSVNETRQFLSRVANSKKVAYLHLCEAAPSLSNGNEKQIGKVLSYLITDFIRAN